MLTFKAVIHLASLTTAASRGDDGRRNPDIIPDDPQQPTTRVASPNSLWARRAADQDADEHGTGVHDNFLPCCVPAAWSVERHRP
jgi:hypothetical protein